MQSAIYYFLYRMLRKMVHQSSLALALKVDSLYPEVDAPQVGGQSTEGDSKWQIQ
jgi:hypothetical protein